MTDVNCNNGGGIGSGEMVVGTLWAQQVPVVLPKSMQVGLACYLLGGAFFARGGIFLHVAECLHWQNGRSDRSNQHANNKTDN